MLTIPKYPIILTPMNNTDSYPVLSPRDSLVLQAQKPRIILASASRIRLSLLREAGLAVTAIPAAIDEDQVKRSARAKGSGPDDVALLLADLKARRIAEPGVAPQGVEADAIVVGADQLLVCDGQWFDKPADLAAAATHLRALRGRSHVLHTAVSVHRGGRTIWQHVARPQLTMRAFSDAMLDAYLAVEGEQLLSSVGAYRLEGPGIQLFDSVQGEHAAILGLPLLALLGFLRQHGILMR